MESIERFSKPLGNLLSFKGDFFSENDRKLREFEQIAELYQSQPLRKSCKNCDKSIDPATPTFTKLSVEYTICAVCGHCNGKYEDTEEFCTALYSLDDGKKYAETYSSADVAQFNERVKEIYFPKALFLKESLTEIGDFPLALSDFGAGAGYFVAAARQCSFSRVKGYEPSKALVGLGNSMLGETALVWHSLDDTVNRVAEADTEVASFVGSLEHLQNPRAVLDALRSNRNIKYVYFSVPLFGPSVVIEAIFPQVMPRHLVAGHTHLYTEKSIKYFCEEFGFRKISAWWFGLDATDLYRSIFISLQKTGMPQDPLIDYCRTKLAPLIDDLQGVFDKAKLCSEVHMLIGKNDASKK